MRITIDMPDFPGFQYTGEYRRPDIKEYYYSNGVCFYAASKIDKEFFILRKEKDEV